MPQNGKMLQLKAPETPPQLQSPVVIPWYFKVILGVTFFILGFNFSNSYFFDANPLFGIPYLAEVMIAPIFALIGYSYVPFTLLKIKEWLEKLIINTVSQIVTTFWAQQSQRIQIARREKQKLKSDEETRKFNEEIAKGIVVDTSVLIDGRILDVVKAGFLENTLIILKSVLHELHLISDSSDKIKRQRGRKGLDTVNELKRLTKVYTSKEAPTDAAADNDLIAFAKAHKLKMLTLDFNLNKLAKASGIKVLNLNDLSNALRTSVLPGEIIKIKIYEKGSSKEQGVGYLSDGTMVVIEDAMSLIGQEVNAKVSKVIQSPAGKMIFANLSKE